MSIKMVTPITYLIYSISTQSCFSEHPIITFSTLEILIKYLWLNFKLMFHQEIKKCIPKTFLIKYKSNSHEPLFNLLSTSVPLFSFATMLYLYFHTLYDINFISCWKAPRMLRSLSRYLTTSPVPLPTVGQSRNPLRNQQ